jgi:hypothetical protein
MESCFGRSYIDALVLIDLHFDSGSSVKRRRQKLGLLASRATTSQMSEADKRQLIVQEMAKDPKGKSGPQMIKQRIFQETGIHLSR